MSIIIFDLMAFILPNRNAPRWLVFLTDLCISLSALTLAYLIRFEFLSIPEEEIDVLRKAFPLFVLIRATSFLVFRTYKGMIRYTSTQDVKRIFLAVFAGTALFLAISPVRKIAVDGYYFLPISILLIEFLITMFLMISLRMMVKMIYLEGKKKGTGTTTVVIFGAGESGLITKRTLDRETLIGFRTIAFVDDDPSKSGKSIEGIPVYATEKLPYLLEQRNVDMLVISIQHPDIKKKARVIEMALQVGVEVRNVPPVRNWIKGELSSGQLRKARIEDLLGRKQITLHNQNIQKEVGGKVILVTGAAGSIGSGLVRELLEFAPQKIVMLDQAESALYDLEFDLLSQIPEAPIELVIGDITNFSRMANIFRTFRPSLVFHAAAYKHVPLMELNPTESVLTNTGGTINLVDLALDHEVEKFVMISTDKAVNPTNVMGASKRIAEIYAQSANKLGKTHFITTRFGNVLGSNGSVIPLFRKQIEQGGPVTVTHPDVTRFFMTIPEACQLVIEAGVMGKGGEIFIFNMGESVRIVDLAEKMIRLSGLEPGKDIEIRYSGLRPGEKLYEELLANAENTLPTHHDQILKAKVREFQFHAVEPLIRNLVSVCKEQNNDDLVKMMKELVPEFVSMNSEFAKFDQKPDAHDNVEQ